MAPTPWTTPDDVTDAWIGPGKPNNVDTIKIWIARAERLVRSRVPNIQERLNSGSEPDLPETVIDVVVSMVSRVFRNPEGIRQKQETTGPFTGSVTYGGDQPGSLSLEDDELSQLTAGKNRHQAFSIDMIPASSPFKT